MGRVWGAGRITRAQLAQEHEALKQRVFVLETALENRPEVRAGFKPAKDDIRYRADLYKLDAPHGGIVIVRSKIDGQNEQIIVAEYWESWRAKVLASHGSDYETYMKRLVSLLLEGLAKKRRASVDEEGA